MQYRNLFAAAMLIGSLFLFTDFAAAGWQNSGNNVYLSNGKVGIGNSYPSAKLQIYNRDSWVGIYNYSNGNNSNYGIYNYVYRNQASGYGYAVGMQNTVQSHFQQGNAYGLQNNVYGTYGNSAGKLSSITASKNFTMPYDSETNNAYGTQNFVYGYSRYKGKVNRAIATENKIYQYASGNAKGVQQGYAGYFTTYKNQASPNMLTAHAVFADARGGDINFGLQARASDTSGNINYGIYVDASGAKLNNYGILGERGDWVLDEDGDGVAGGTGSGGDLILGEEQDLEIYHDGTDSFIQNNTGRLNIDSGDGDICIGACDGISVQSAGEAINLKVLDEAAAAVPVADEPSDEDLAPPEPKNIPQTSPQKISPPPITPEPEVIETAESETIEENTEIKEGTEEVDEEIVESAAEMEQEEAEETGTEEDEETETEPNETSDGIAESDAITEPEEELKLEEELAEETVVTEEIAAEEPAAEEEIISDEATNE